MTTDSKRHAVTVQALPPASELPDDLGESMHSLVQHLYPLTRSITGAGLRQTLRLIGETIDLSISEVPTGTRVFDWEVPAEWNIRDAYVKAPDGNRVVDFRKCNLHVVGYSTPVDRKMTLAELKPHLHTMPDKPDWIPYRTSYYNDDWGFCLAHNDYVKLSNDEYEVFIDSDLSDGSLTYAECVIPGATDNEVLFFTHTCHPSLCNDNLSGIALCTHLALALSDFTPRYTYRFVFAPATIGSIAWLAKNEGQLGRIRHGLVLSAIGDDGDFVYKRSRIGNADIDRATAHVLSTTVDNAAVRNFSPWGYDERQFCSPGLNLPVGSLTRTSAGEYPEYHTSADDLSFVKPVNLLDSLRTVWRILEVLEGNATFVNQSSKGEPQLGRRGLYRKMGGYQDVEREQLAMLWVLNQSDGSHSLLSIAEKAKLPFRVVRNAANRLIDAKLLLDSHSE